MYIRTKLVVIIIVIFIGLGSIIGIDFYSDMRISSLKSMKMQGETLLFSLSNLNNLTKDLLITSKNTLNKVYIEWGETYPSISDSIKGFLLSKRLENLLSGVELQEQLKTIREQWTVTNDKLNGVSNAMNYYDTEMDLTKKAGLLIEIENPSDPYAKDVYNQIAAGISHLNDIFFINFRDFLSIVDTKATDAINQTLIILRILIAVILVTIVVISVIFIKYIYKRLQITDLDKRKIIDGIFIDDNENTNDEISLLLYNFNEFSDSLKYKLETTLSFLRKVGTAMSDRLNINEVIQLIVESAAENTKADGCILLLLDEENPDNLKIEGYVGFYPPIWKISETLKNKKIQHIISYFKNTPIKRGENLIGRSVSTNVPVFIKNADTDNRIDEANRDKEGVQYISSFISVPLVISERVIGAISIVRTANESYFSDIDFNNIQTFADYATLTIDNLVKYIQLMERYQLEKEVGIAAQIQDRLLPKELPRLRNAEVKAFSNPLRGVSGDYYDIIKLNEDKVAVIMCDVAGKGVPAALIMIMINTIIKLTSSPERGASMILNWLNKGLSGRVGEGNFATIGYVIFNQKTREILYSNAAHIPLILYREKQKKYFYIDAEGLPIGVDVNAKYQQKRFILNPGDVLVMYTDGISEAMNKDGDQYETESIIKVLRKCVFLPANDILARVKEDLSKFVEDAKQHDDQTLLVLKGT
jgi:phosphoserine phosphatase RsbU/P